MITQRPLLFPALLLTGLLAAAPARAAETEGGSTSVIEMILHGGPLIIMIWIAILVTSIVMVTFIIQLFLQVRRQSLAPKALVTALDESLRAGNFQEAWETCRANAKTYIAAVLGGALERVGRGKDATDNALIELGIRESQAFKTRNSYLSVIGVIAPMIGLLGTVIGMMGAMAALGVGNNPGVLAAKIGEVLLATASGLFIAIPAFVAYYVFRNISQMCIVHADDVVNNLLLDIPYDELAGVQIGENFDAGAPAAGYNPGVRKVSIALTTACPVCNGAVTPGVNPCPHCGTTLDWAA
jgi:biopolymer transport protein ExbB